MVRQHRNFNSSEFVETLTSAILEGRLTDMITPEKIRNLLAAVKREFTVQPVLLRINAPVIICGDLHGQFNDLIRIFNSEGFPDTRNYLFLGDYVDRGTQSVELILFMLAIKCRYPKNFFMLRGNHETEGINRIYGFRKDIMDKYHSEAIYDLFQKVFEMMPLSAVVSDQILCMHGGLSSELLAAKSLDVINTIERPLKEQDLVISKNKLALDLMWADPDVNVAGFGRNRRGISNTFGQEIINAVRRKFGLEFIVRAHQVVLDGHEFFDDNISSGLVTLFSAPHYCGLYNNSGAVIRVSGDLQISFQIFQPRFETNRAQG